MKHTDRRLLEAAGLDVELGLSCCLNSPELYRRMLGCFLVSHRHDCLKLEQILCCYSSSLLWQLLHKLKGAALNIGARRLHDLALNTESLCDQPENSLLSAHIAELTNALSALLRALEQISPSSAADSYPLDLLTQQLRAGNPEAIRTYDGLDTTQLQCLSPEQRERLRVAIYGFDFNAALASLPEQK